MTVEYRRAYSKGYAAGSKGCWPEHRPPTPPDPISSSIISTANALRDEADGFIATIDADDPIAVALGEKIDAFDAAMTELSKWLKSPATEGE